MLSVRIRKVDSEAHGGCETFEAVIYQEDKGVDHSSLGRRL